MRPSPLFPILLSGALSLAAAAGPGAQPAVPRAGTEAGSQQVAPAADSPSQAAQDKFRKLQQEMRRTEPELPAAPVAETGENRGEGTLALGTLVMQIVLGLGFVLILAVVTIRLLKRMQGKLLSGPGKGGKGGDLFEVLETCHLGANQRVVALRMNGEVGILGVTTHGISLLTVLNEPAEEVRRARTGGNSEAFSENLNKLLERFKKPRKVSDLIDEGGA
jgi:flagellar biogenesis protein FliO